MCYFFDYIYRHKFKPFMKKILSLAIVAAICATSFAQSRIATADYSKTTQPAVQTDIPFPEKTVSKAIDDQLQKKGYKGKDTKGYLTYKGVSLPQLGAGTYDLYFKTDRKSKKEKDFTTVTLLVSSGYDKFLSEADNPTVIAGAKTYLDNLTSQIASYDLEQQIVEQEEVVKKTTKKHVSYNDNGEALKKKMIKLQEEMDENVKNQATQKTEVDKQATILETLKSKRKQ